MKLLFVMFAPPAPSNAGHRVRNRTLLQALQAEGHQVSLLCYADAEEMESPSPELAGLCRDFRLVQMPAQNQIWGRLATLFARRPYGAIRLESEAMQAAVAETLARESYDAIVCDDVYLLANLPADTPLPVLLNKHDLTHRIVGQFVRAEKNVLKKLYGQLEARKIRRLEIEACMEADAVLACSEWDAELIRRDCPAAKVFVLPNVVDVESYVPSRGDDGHTVLFVGAMEWLPNRDGVAYFIGDILPKLRALVPGVRFLVAGRNPSAEFRAQYAGLADVEFTGTVGEIQDVIAPAAVCVAPLRMGSGTRLKILEAAAMAKPVVSTSLGAEGLEFRHGEEILLAEDSCGFAESTALLLNRPDLRRTLGEAARKRVERNYSLISLRATIAEVLPSVSAASKDCRQLEHNSLVT